MSNVVPDWIDAAAERGATEHIPGAQDAQALQMLDNGHFINPYGDTYEAGSVAASNEAEPWLGATEHALRNMRRGATERALLLNARC